MASNTKYYDNLTVSNSPHLVTSLDTTRTMLYVVAALCPAAAVSILYFGISAVVMIAVCMISCAFFEWAYEKILNKPSTVRDGSALVTGLILALNLPANLTHLDSIEYPVFMPILICIIGSFVAIVIVKQLFGGMGRNFANPAIVGRITLFLSFTSYMSTWPLTRFQKAGIDAVTGATPLGYLADGSLTYSPSLKDMFLGNIGGAMGETCVIAILIGAIFLICMKIISPIIPVCFVATVFIFALVYYAATGGGPDGQSALYMACFHVCAGGVMFGAVFCATDYVTSPIMKLGKVMFGIGCGLVTMIIRLFCSYPEGVSFAILFMNIMTPLLNSIAEDRFYQISKRKKAAAAEKKA
ncbi:MAG: RnfABCDGE type electron transport complex subunit D [Eubacteriales bacterium]|nr:RnfABCDGE type electron transport complex subunit D [Eubacteriales bacterium]